MNNNLFLELGKFIDAERIIIESFSMEWKNNDKSGLLLDVEIRFSNYRLREDIHILSSKVSSKNICDFIGKNLLSFFIELNEATSNNKKKKGHPMENNKNDSQKREKLKNYDEYKNKVGEIRNKDGTITIFYKSKDNKIQRMKKKED